MENEKPKPKPRFGLVDGVKPLAPDACRLEDHVQHRWQIDLAKEKDADGAPLNVTDVFDPRLWSKCDKLKAGDLIRINKNSADPEDVDSPMRVGSVAQGGAMIQLWPRLPNSVVRAFAEEEARVKREHAELSARLLAELNAAGRNPS
jgi:hypothetical protein